MPLRNCRGAYVQIRAYYNDRETKLCNDVLHSLARFMVVELLPSAGQCHVAICLHRLQCLDIKKTTCIAIGHQYRQILLTLNKSVTYFNPYPAWATQSVLPRFSI